MRVYLDNAATTPLDDEVLSAMIPFMKEHFGNPSSTYAEGRATKAAIERYRKIIAEGLGASTGEIYFTSGGTEANNTALKCAVRDLNVQRIITSPIEHSCVKNTCLSLKEFDNTQIDYVELDEFGRAKLDHLATLLATGHEGKTLVSLMHANNEIGTLNDIEAIGQLCQQYNAYFHSDTVQTIGHIPIDVNKLHIHFLSGSAHKLHGPKGSGFLYVNKSTNIGCLIHGGGQERRMRSGTENVIGIIGLGKAFECAIQKIDQHTTHIEEVRTYFIDALESKFGEIVRFNGDYKGAYLPTVLSVSFKTDISQAMLLFRLDLQGISASGGSACSSGANTGSYVIHKLGVPSEYKTVRFSFANQTTKACIDHTINALSSILL